MIRSTSAECGLSAIIRATAVLKDIQHSLLNNIFNISLDIFLFLNI